MDSPQDSCHKNQRKSKHFGGWQTNTIFELQSHLAFPENLLCLGVKEFLGFLTAVSEQQLGKIEVPVYLYCSKPV